MSEITLGDGAGWVSTTVDRGVNYDGNVGGGEGGGSGVSTAVGEGMEQLRSVAIFKFNFSYIPQMTGMEP